MSGKIPVWPLPSDWQWAGGPEKPAPTSLCPNPTVQCPHCTQWLSFAPNDAPNGLRRHKRGLKCKKGREVIAMNMEGYHAMSTSGNGFWSESLRPFMREGKHYKFFPAPIVSFVRWKLANDGVSSAGASKEFHAELTEFLALSEEEQVAQLSGAILQYEFEREALGRSGQSFPRR